MAIDTAEKRRSCIGIGLPFRLTLPKADGTIDQGGRQHLVGLYAGFTPALPPLLGGRIVAGFAFLRGSKAGAAFTRGPASGFAFARGAKAGYGRSS